MNIFVSVLIFLNLPWDSILFELAALSGLGGGKRRGGRAARRRAGQPTQATPRAARACPESGPRGAREAGGRTGAASASLGRRAGSLEAASESGEGAPRRFVSPLLEPGEPLLPRPAAGAPGGSGRSGGGGIGSSFTPFLSSHSLTGCGGGGNRGGKQIPPGAIPRGGCGRDLPPKHSPKSGPLGEDFRLLGEPCQASWDL